MARHILLGCLVLAGCGDDGSTTTMDALTVPPMITISGTAVAYTPSGSQPIAGVLVGAYRVGNDAAPEVTGMSDANGNYSVLFATNGQAIDGYLKATLATYMDTYVYPPFLITQDYNTARVAMVTPATLDIMAGTLCGALPQADRATIAAIVGDADENPLAGATVACSPAATKYCYNAGGFPNRTATSTDTDGIAYFLTVPAGRVTVSAMAPGVSFPSHAVTARPGVFTTTLITP